MMGGTNKIILGLFVAVCLMSCERRPLEILATSLKIVHNPDYFLEYKRPESTPEHYRVNMYDMQTGKLVYKDFVPDGGGEIRSMPGDYLCFLCNYDEGRLILNGEEDINTFHILGPDAGAYADSTFAVCQKKVETYVGQRVISITDCFWAGYEECLVPSLAETDSAMTITVNTASVMKQGFISLNDIQGMENISNIQCFITNLSAGINPITGALDAENVTERFVITDMEGQADGDFLYFGINGGDIPHLLFALVTDICGAHYLYVYDLGPMDDENGLFFNIDSKIRIPEPAVQGGGGFSPELDDWSVIYIEVPLG